MYVRVNGLVSGLVSYRYHLNGRPLRRYSMEQQAQIIADYFILKTYGYASWMALRARGDVTLDGDLGSPACCLNIKKHCRGFHGAKKGITRGMLLLASLLALTGCPGSGDRLRPDETTSVRRTANNEVCFAVHNAQDYQPVFISINPALFRHRNKNIS
jgi:hypothetical protein